MNAAEYVERVKSKHQKRQKKYIESKIDQGYVELRVWLLCNKSTMYELKQVLKNLPEYQIKQIIDKYVA